MNAPDPGNAPDPAFARFWMLNLMRIGGVMLAVAGALMIAGRLPAPPVLGYGLLLFGLFEFFVMPRMLARRWKSPPQ